MDAPETIQSSIVVAVRVRPFTEDEQERLVKQEHLEMLHPGLGDSNLVLPGSTGDGGNADKWTNGVRPPAMIRPRGIRSVVECVDDKMLIFDPSETNPLNKVSETVLNSMYSQKQVPRRQYRRNGGELRFIFDKLLGQNSNQRQVYESTTRSLLDSVLDGYNGTVFAYGATGCGKTYTVSGTPDEPGIVFLAMQELFERIEDLKDQRQFELSLSYLEIYNERIRDLLQPETPSQKLFIREDKDNVIKVTNLSHHYPKTVQDVMDLVIKGNINRTTSPTDANETSSRSHAVLQIHIVQTNRNLDLTKEHTYATLSIIDLAGSERAASTKNRGERLHEGANINRSLLALGNCINALCLNDGTRRSCHVPYRDSKLTRLLKFSLGGNCKTVMIVCISPSSTHYDETLNTLKYANRAKEIKTKVLRNQQSLNRHVGSYLKMITEQKKEIDELRQREKTIVDLKLQKFQVTRNRVMMGINDCMEAIRHSFNNSEKFQHLRTTKSLILCKRRFLQLVQLEVDNTISLVQNASDVTLYNKCMILNEQLLNKIYELEAQFDVADEFDQIMERARTVDLPRLRELENWNESQDTSIFEKQLEHIFSELRSNILVDASTMVEALLENKQLVRRTKFLSMCLATDQSIEQSIEDLVHIDEEFESFSRIFFQGRTEETSTEKKSSSNRSIRVTKSTNGKGSNSPSPKPRQKTLPISPDLLAKKVRWFPEESPNIRDSIVANTTLQEQDVDVSMQDATTPQPSKPTTTAAAAQPKTYRNSLLNYKLVGPR